MFSIEKLTLKFKSKISPTFTKEKIDAFVKHTKKEIAIIAKEQLSGKVKKQFVVQSALNFIVTVFVPEGFLAKIVLRLLIMFVPNIVEYMYDLLNTKLEDVIEA